LSIALDRKQKGVQKIDSAIIYISERAPMSDTKRIFYLGPPLAPGTSVPAHPLVSVLESVAAKTAPLTAKLGEKLPYIGVIEDGTETKLYLRASGILIRDDFEQTGERLNGARVYLTAKGWAAFIREGQVSEGNGRWQAERLDLDAQNAFWWLGGVQGSYAALRLLLSKVSSHPQPDMYLPVLIRYLRQELRRKLLPK
jgi:hypothetical protein